MDCLRKKDGLLPSFFAPTRCMSAAALSAAVDTTKLIGDHTHSQAEPTKKKDAPKTPAALRERGSGGEGLLSEKPPLPQNLQHLPRNLQFRKKKGTMELFIWHHLFQTVDEEVLQWSSTCS